MATLKDIVNKNNEEMNTCFMKNTLYRYLNDKSSKLDSFIRYNLISLFITLTVSYSPVDGLKNRNISNIYNLCSIFNKLTM